VNVAPTPQERSFGREQHVPLTQAQVAHVQQAQANPALFAHANGGHPPIAATPRPALFSGPGVVGAHGAPPLNNANAPVNTPMNRAVNPGVGVGGSGGFTAHPYVQAPVTPTQNGVAPKVPSNTLNTPHPAYNTTPPPPQPQPPHPTFNNGVPPRPVLNNAAPPPPPPPPPPQNGVPKQQYYVKPPTQPLPPTPPQNVNPNGTGKPPPHLDKPHEEEERH